MAWQNTTEELLESLLAGHKMTARELDEMLANKVPEDLFLDYKHSDVLGDKSKRSHLIRKYVSGFANSAGGILIIGADQASWSIAPGLRLGGDLAEWASRCLTDIAQFLSPPPRISTIKYKEGQVLIVAVARSPNLVPCIESGGIVYYLRLHDQTLKVPEYLASDLMLGRRQHPHLRVYKVGLAPTINREFSEGTIDVRGALHISFDNFSLMSVDDLRLGVIYYAHRGPTSLSQYLLSYITVLELPDLPTQYRHMYNLFHDLAPSPRERPLSVDPFTKSSLHCSRIAIPLKIGETYPSYTWRAAAYLISNGSPPIWYQIDIEASESLFKAIKENQDIDSDSSDLIKFYRSSSGHAIVGWQNLKNADGYSI